jgi:oxygen-independent coproporphyrinogen III oxidase
LVEDLSRLDVQGCTSLYLHIPFCRSVCHYCDFAKTANYDNKSTENYFRTLGHHLNSVDFQNPLKTLFLGGGTPSLFAKEYESIFHKINFDPQCEISLEANPEDLHLCKDWKNIGINRLSIGVQTFSPLGLKTLTRLPSNTLKESILKAHNHFPNLNIDLIYGWPGQSLADWQSDLSWVLEHKIPHVSLYALTFEAGTVFGRKLKRDIMHAPDDDQYLEYYSLACELLRGTYTHEEVSNWSLPGFSCRHNWVYWSDQSYLGLGVGAHSYLAEADGIGRRFFYDKSLYRFLNDPIVHTDEGRSKESWLYEYLGSALRTHRGVDLKRIEAKIQLKPQPIKWQELLKKYSCQIHLKDDHIFYLQPPAWFSEMQWIHKIRGCFEI